MNGRKSEVVVDPPWAAELDHFINLWTRRTRPSP